MHRCIASWLLIAFIVIPSMFAATFRQFDQMNTEAQAEYVARMLDETEKALIREGNAATAAQIDHLFTTVLPGDHMALGLVEYERNEARARVFDAERAENDRAHGDVARHVSRVA